MICVLTIAAISEFAKAKSLSPKQAFHYLNLFKGINFLKNDESQIEFFSGRMLVTLLYGLSKKEICL